MGLLDTVKAALLAKRVADRLKEASMKGKLWATVYGLVAAGVSGVIAKLTEVCPTLIPNLWPIATGAVVAGIALYVNAPEKGKGVKATVLAIATAVGTSLIAKFTETCPALAQNVGVIVSTGLLAGVGLWVKSPKQA